MVKGLGKVLKTWSLDKLGRFTVRSAYMVAKRMLRREENEVEFRTAKVVLKVKYFIWRLLWMILPTMDNLGAKGVNINRGCCVCEEKESIFHIMFECRFNSGV